jgi:hypothetical protein
MTVEHARLNIIRAHSTVIRDAVDRTHQIILAAKKLLSKSMPDTFLGRKTHEFFPREKISEPPEC